jgi:outer membrane biogenesis lipoprotein LolB
MLAQIRNSPRSTSRIAALALLSATTVLTSCATKEQPALISDGSATRDSSIPWDKQEKWESQGQFANMTDRR